jgi:tRNA threonylcarbamoyladenosine biosynthesis protein TsaB
MRILAIASASEGCAVALVGDATVLAEGGLAGRDGLADRIPGLIAEVLGRGGAAEAVGVVVGPGGFTALRAGIAAAAGVALARGIPIVGVSVAEALAEALAESQPLPGHRPLWIATQARRGHVVLEAGGAPQTMMLEAVPSPPAPIALAGDAANAVAALLAARGCNIMLTSARRALPRHVAAVAARRLGGDLPPLAAVPLYAEPPRISVPSAAPRPPPVAA